MSTSPHASSHDESGSEHPRLAARPLGPQAPRAAVRRFADVVPLRRTEPPAAAPGPWAVPPAVPKTPQSAGPAPSAARADADRAEQRQVASVVHMVAQAVFEALAGARPVHQLARWLDPENYEKLRLRVELTRAARPARTAGARGPVVRRTRVCRVAEGSYEAAVVVAEPERVRAAALRIERRRGQWRVCELEIG